MTEDCTHLDALAAWFGRALDVLTDPAVRRDVLLLVGGAATVAEAVSVTAGDVVAALDHLFVYPPAGGGHSLPLTPA
ncbi:MAG: hypothetical protein QOE45_2891, partial [Frankiaceae bacterium]|nr:hypothetical protein [Frankiaceae bacterium]